MMRAACLLVAACALASGCDPAPALDWDDPRTVGTEPSPVPPDAESVVFAVLGDMGEAGVPQEQVAESVAQECVDAGCQFAVMLGDNLYDAGLDGTVATENRLRALLDMYPAFPKFLVLGNHDWDAVRSQLPRAQRQLDWIAQQEDVFGAFHYYDVRAGPAHLWGLDSNWIVRHLGDERTPALAQWGASIGSGDAPWVFAFGHHPLLSNGTHGNAGSYLDRGARLWDGQGFRAFLERHVVGQADVYMAGHDHNLNFFPGAGAGAGDGTASLVSGAAAKCRPVGSAAMNPGDGEVGSGVTATYEHYGYGFAIVTATRTELSVTMHPLDGRSWTTRRTVDDDRWTIDGGEPSVDRESHCE